MKKIIANFKCLCETENKFECAKPSLVTASVGRVTCTECESEAIVNVMLKRNVKGQVEVRAVKFKASPMLIEATQAALLEAEEQKAEDIKAAEAEQINGLGPV